MRVKDLAHWIASFNLPPTPWVDADWKTALNLLARILHETLEQRFLLFLSFNQYKIYANTF